ncbi:unnamed protein product [Adineta steineri]|uniref:DNA helicase n=1 Tax=Adineta steineri TaxID=433720 RepID=A0A819WDM0_9BILA|nr:unnamed protein product [Adineta steineri]
MRTKDRRYLKLLDRLRHGKCNQSDYELLLTRVVGQPSVKSLSDSPWNKAPLLVYRNAVRTQLNNKAAIHKAAEVGQALMVCIAQDSCKGKPIEDPMLMKKLLKLSDSKTEHLPGLLPFVPGMPVILTQNLATELGLINGVNGIFRQLVYHEESISTESLSQIFPNNTQYIRRPTYALIEISQLTYRILILTLNGHGHVNHLSASAHSSADNNDTTDSDVDDDDCDDSIACDCTSDILAPDSTMN